MVLKDLERRQAVATVLLVLDELDLSARDRRKLDISNRIEQFGPAKLGPMLTVVKQLWRVTEMIALGSEQILHGVGHREHAVDDKVNEAVLGDAQILFAGARHPAQRGRDHRTIYGAIELLFPELGEPRIARVAFGL